MRSTYTRYSAQYSGQYSYVVLSTIISIACLSVKNRERRPHSYLPFVPKPKQPCCCINYFIYPPFPPPGPASYSPLISSGLARLRLFQREKAKLRDSWNERTHPLLVLIKYPLCPSYLILVKTNRKPSICLFVSG